MKIGPFLVYSSDTSHAYQTLLHYVSQLIIAVTTITELLLSTTEEWDDSLSVPLCNTKLVGLGLSIRSVEAQQEY